MIIESMLGLALSMPVDPSLKCPRTHHLPGFPQESPVVIVDGEIRRGEAQESLRDINPSDIYKIDIKCWDPVTDSLPASSGIQLILITTKAPVTAAEASTREALRLVRAFLDDNGWTARSLETVDPSLKGYSVEFQEIELQEVAPVVMSPDINGIECVTSRIDRPAEEVECVTTYSVAKQALRTAWEARGQAF